MLLFRTSIVILLNYCFKLLLFCTLVVALCFPFLLRFLLSNLPCFVLCLFRTFFVSYFRTSIVSQFSSFVLSLFRTFVISYIQTFDVSHFRRFTLSLFRTFCSFALSLII